jgi:hypothetical protein
MNKAGSEGGHDAKSQVLRREEASAPRCVWAIVATCAFASAFVSQAACAYSNEGVLDQPIGTVTRQALDLQRSGAQSAPARPMSGEQAGLAYDRYLNSFSHPIPEFLNSTLKSGSDSGSSSSQ